MSEIDEMSELVDARIPRVDLVKGPASGRSFLIAKSAADPDTAARQRMAASGAAMPDGSYPIETKTQLERAIHAVGRGNADHDAIRRHIITRAESLGASSMIPDNWNKDGSLSVAKAADDGDMTADEVLADPAPESARDVLDGAALDAPGDPDDPGSAAWEAVDAARARAMVAAVTSLKASLAEAASREASEAVSDSGDEDDAGNACDLDDAQDALDWLLSVLAPFAACEQAEADERAERLSALMKATVTVMKAGRVLSAANLAAVKSAIAALQEVASAAEPPPADSEESEVEKAELVVKAGDSLADVSDADLKRQVLTGSVAERNAALAELGLRTLTGESGGDAADSDSATDSDDDSDDESADDSADDSDAADAPADASAGDSDASTIPGTATVQSPPDDSDDVTKAEPLTQDVIKSAFVDALQQALAQQEDVVKASLAALEERLARVEGSPAPGGPYLNGSTGAAGAVPRDPATDDLADLRKAAEAETDPQRRRELAYAAAFAEVKKAQTAPPSPFTGDPAAVIARFTQ